MKETPDQPAPASEQRDPFDALATIFEEARESDTYKAEMAKLETDEHGTPLAEADQLLKAAKINESATEAFAKGETLERLSSLPDDFKPRYPLKIDPLIYNHLTTTFTKEDWLALAAAATDQAQ